MERYGEYFEHAIVDGRNRVINFTLDSDGAVRTSVPHFWSDFGML